MNKSNRKKALPPWVPILVILVVIGIIVVVYWRSSQRGPRAMSQDEQTRSLQAFVNEGGVPIVPRARLEAMGVTFPPDYEQRVAQRNAKMGNAGGAPGGRPGPAMPGR